MSLHAQFAVTRGPMQLDVELAVARGETLALVGPNGAGKTTCLHAIAGLVRMERSAIRLDDRWLDGGPDAAHTAPEQRGIGLLFQDHLLFPHLTALDNVAYGPIARGVGRRAARAKATDWLSRMGLAGRGAARPRELSGGQAQRVALARALAAEPNLLLLDEPLAAVDASARRDLRRDLVAHLRAFAGPRIIVTHDAMDAFMLADRIAVLEQGRIVQVGTAAAISAAPRSRYVADLIGLNFFRGVIRGGALHLANGAQLVVVSTHEGPALATLHPRAVALFHERPAGSPRNTWQAPIEALEPSLDSVRVRLGGPAPLVAEVTSGTVATMGLRPGMPIYLAIKATEVNVLPE
jgi:molybdate transport system ATP-binding protein